MNLITQMIQAISKTEMKQLILVHTFGDVMDLEVINDDGQFLFDSSVRAGFGAVINLNGKNYLIAQSKGYRVTCSSSKDAISRIVLDDGFFDDFEDESLSWCVFEETTTKSNFIQSVYHDNTLWQMISDMNLNFISDLNADVYTQRKVDKEILISDLEKVKVQLFENLDKVSLNNQIESEIA